MRDLVAVVPAWRESGAGQMLNRGKLPDFKPEHADVPQGGQFAVAIPAAPRMIDRPGGSMIACRILLTFNLRMAPSSPVSSRPGTTAISSSTCRGGTANG
jgi:hypothetical protein